MSVWTAGLPDPAGQHGCKPDKPWSPATRQVASPESAQKTPPCRRPKSGESTNRSGGTPSKGKAPDPKNSETPTDNGSPTCICRTDPTQRHSSQTFPRTEMATRKKNQTILIGRCMRCNAPTSRVTGVGCVCEDCASFKSGDPILAKKRIDRMASWLEKKIRS